MAHSVTLSNDGQKSFLNRSKTLADLLVDQIQENPTCPKKSLLALRETVATAHFLFTSSL